MYLHGDEFLQSLNAVQCILKHCDHIGRDGLQNSKDKLEMIEEDARAIEGFMLGERGIVAPLHFD